MQSDTLAFQLKNLMTLNPFKKERVELSWVVITSLMMMLLLPVILTLSIVEGWSIAVGSLKGCLRMNGLNALSLLHGLRVMVAICVILTKFPSFQQKPSVSSAAPSLFISIY